nr:MAG TPA: hypothetical protein [Caudoviricetes sp.]
MPEEWSRAEAAVRYLTSLLHYHERVTACAGGVIMSDGTAIDIPYGQLFDGYADALREAIRCVKQVNGIE